MSKILQLSTKATYQILNIAKKYNTDIISLSIKGGGCSGFNYLIEPKSLNDKFSEKIDLSKDVTMEVCSKSIMYIIGTKIDWEKTIMGESFTFNNPNASGICGCGTSFSV